MNPIITGLEPDRVVDLQLSPNPASEELRVSYTLDKADVVEFSLTDLIGKNHWLTSVTRDAGRHGSGIAGRSIPVPF